MGTTLEGLRGGIELQNLDLYKPVSIAAAMEPAFFAVMEPVQSAQKTVLDTSFKVPFSPPFLGLYFLVLGRDLALLFSPG